MACPLLVILGISVVAPVPCSAGTVRYRGPYWKRASFREPVAQPAAVNATVQSWSSHRAFFPNSTDFRDPNAAWSDGAKLGWLAIYAIFWASVVGVVHIWPSIASVSKRMVPNSRQRTGISSATGGTGSTPLLADNSETNVGDNQTWYPKDKLVTELFEAKAKELPSDTALVIPGSPKEKITYKELMNAVDELAERLLSVGITCPSVVALILERSVAQIVAVYGVLQAGAAFLPVDKDAPWTRKQFLIANGEAAAVVGVLEDESTQELVEQVGGRAYYFALPSDGSVGAIKEVSPAPRSRTGSFSKQISDSPGLAAHSVGSEHVPGIPAEKERPGVDEMALLIYTSGTTGQPKGIVYDHQHLMHGVYFFGKHCEMTQHSVGLLKSPYFWAIIEWEMFPVLTLGGKLVVASSTGHKSPEYLAETIISQEVSVLMITPQVLDLVLDVVETNKHSLRALKHIVTVGEPLTCALANRAVAMRGLDAQVHNFYGASESSCTIYTVPKDGIDLSIFPSKAPAGKPQPYAKVYVMRDEKPNGDTNAPVHLVPVPLGEAGEICFGGILAACYWKHDELTAEKWVDTEYGRLYRTGDLGRWKAGELEVTGRADRQVKIRGVRVEPEEVEAVLKKFEQASENADLEQGSVVCDIATALALKEVSVVASKEPSELVAFVTLRNGVSGVTIEALRAHCELNLAPAYVPKFYIIEDEMPKLPNGKPNLSELKERASKLVTEEGEVVMDSLGQMKKLSKWAIFENQVIHRCYAFWMIGVMTDHWMRCAIDMDKGENQYYPFCTVLARSSVQPWTEILIRSFFGNDQDMFGFIMLGAYQDSRPVNGKSKVNLGVKDLFVFLVYMLMALPFPQLIYYLTGGWAWPVYWDGAAAPSNIWGWDYMQYNSDTSDHRWYLLMVLEARIFLQIMETLRAPSWLQALLIIIPNCLPNATFEEGQYLIDVCELSSAKTYVLYTFSYIFRNFGDGCAMYWRWVHWYVTFYVLSYHYLRPLVNCVAANPMRSLEAAQASGKAPGNRTLAAVAFSCSMMIGMLMALYHYPNNVLENGTGLQWVWLELGTDMIQPALIVIGMASLPFDMAWWGNTTLGTYVFHFYFKDQAGLIAMCICDALSWDASGLLVFVFIIAICIAFTSILGPMGHYFLLSCAYGPGILYSRAKRRYRSYRAARNIGCE